MEGAFKVSNIPYYGAISTIECHTRRGISLKLPHARRNKMDLKNFAVFGLVVSGEDEIPQGDPLKL